MSKNLRFKVNKSLNKKSTSQLWRELFYRTLDGNKSVKRIKAELTRRGVKVKSKGGK